MDGLVMEDGLVPMCKIKKQVVSLVVCSRLNRCDEPDMKTILSLWVCVSAYTLSIEVVIGLRQTVDKGDDWPLLTTVSSFTTVVDGLAARMDAVACLDHKIKNCCYFF